MRVFHYAQGAVAVRTAAESVQEIGQSVLMQGTCNQYSGDVFSHRLQELLRTETVQVFHHAVIIQDGEL